MTPLAYPNPSFVKGVAQPTEAMPVDEYRKQVAEAFAGLSALPDLFQRYLDAHAAVTASSEEYEALVGCKPSANRNYPNAPKVPAMVENPAVYIPARIEYEVFCGQERYLRQAYDGARRDLSKACDALLKTMPHDTWFRFGNVGFGLMESNWGGHHYSVLVRPWVEEMPSLRDTNEYN